MDLPGQEEIAKEYRAASDARLIEVALSYDSLTPQAQSALRAEFEQRRLEPPEIPELPPMLEYRRLTTIRQYRDLVPAQVARAALESAGISCYLRDENSVRMEWVWSNLFGGMRLQVAEEDLEAAEAILSQPIPEQIPVDGEDVYEQPSCPQCSSLDIHYQAIHERLGMASVLTFVPLPIPKRAWICDTCGAQWQVGPEGPAT